MELVTSKQRRELLKIPDPNVASTAADVLLELKKRSLVYPWIQSVSDIVVFTWGAMRVVLIIGSTFIEVYYINPVEKIWYTENTSDIAGAVDVLSDKIEKWIDDE